MKINRCPDCAGRLVADILEDEVMVRCNACGQELGTFDRADKPVIISDNELYPLTADDLIDVNSLPPCPVCESEDLIVNLRPTEKGYGEYSIHCTNCGKSTGWFASKQEVLEAWEGIDSNEDGRLKRCPFCGSTQIAVQRLTPDGELPTGSDKFYFNVWCSRCDAKLSNPDNDTEEKAVTAWNRRVHDANLINSDIIIIGGRAGYE